MSDVSTLPTTQISQRRLAAFSGVTRPVVDRWIASGLLPARGFTDTDLLLGRVLAQLPRSFDAHLDRQAAQVMHRLQRISPETVILATDQHIQSFDSLWDALPALGSTSGRTIAVLPIGRWLEEHTMSAAEASMAG